MSDRLPEAPALELDDPMPYPAAPVGAAPIPARAVTLGEAALGWGAAAIATVFWRHPAAWVEVSPREESRLFTFARRVAIEVQAPVPARIFLAPEAVLAAHGARDLVVGLGLLHALGLSEFKAVVAHVLVRASQPGAALDRWRAVSASRLLYADRVAARVAGTDAALSAIERARFAEASWRAAMEALDDARDEGVCTDDLYAHLDGVRSRARELLACAPVDDTRARHLRAWPVRAEPDARGAWGLLRDPAEARRRVTAAFYAARGDHGALVPAAQVERALSREREGADADPRWRGAFARRTADPGDVDALLGRAGDPALRQGVEALDGALASRAADLDARLALTDLGMALALGGDVAEACARRWRAQHALAGVVTSLDALCKAQEGSVRRPPEAARRALDEAVSRARVVVGEEAARELDPEGARLRVGADVTRLREVARAMRRRAVRLARANLCAVLAEHVSMEVRWRAAGCPRPRPHSLAVPTDLAGQNAPTKRTS